MNISLDVCKAAFSETRNLLNFHGFFKHVIIFFYVYDAAYNLEELMINSLFPCM